MTPTYLLLVYKDHSGYWRWRLSHRNGKTLADGGEGYATKGSATRAARRLTIIAASAVLQTRKA
jgi:uncharacterized protein YegP (UPF0339 family)